MDSASSVSELVKAPVPLTIRDPKHRRAYKVFRKGDDLFQSEYALDSNGKEILQQTFKLAYVIGAGEEGFSYLIDRGGFLFQAPLSYYVRTKAWALSPGYEVTDYGFTRPILEQCIVCHSGQPRPQSPRSEDAGSALDIQPFRPAEPPFAELAIGCENCHGPGQLHIAERKTGAPLTGDIDTAIVNPAKLPTWLANQICMRCHQGGDARVLMPGKAPFDFRPGRPLSETVAIFQLPLSPESPPLSPLLGHYYGMTLSRCYLASGGKLGCLTCHDPHMEPPEAAAYYRQKCLQCHSEASCKLPLAVRRQHKPADDCADCHMPKQTLVTVSHSALTDHRIAVTPAEPYPPETFQQTSPSFTDLLDLDTVPGERGPGLPDLVLLAAYAQLIPSHPEQYQARYLELLGRVSNSPTRNAFVTSALAQRELWVKGEAGRPGAVQYLEQSIRSGSTYSADYLRLGTLYALADRTRDAISVLEKGIAIAPFDESLYMGLASDYLSIGDRAQAVETIKKGLQMLPEDAPLQQLLAQLSTAEH